MDDRFFTKLWQGTAPLLLWSAHFAFCYLYAAAGCRPATWAVLAGATALALAAAGWLVWRACRRNDRSLTGLAQLGSAILGLAGIAWGSLPLLVFGTCA